MREKAKIVTQIKSKAEEVIELAVKEVIDDAA